MKTDPNNLTKPAAASGFGIQDLLFVMFRRKWLILFFTLLGIAGAIVLYVKQPVLYESSAKLLVKYVIAHSDVDSWEQKNDAGGRYADYVTDTEVKILTSWDVARSVVSAVGVEHFVPDDEPEDSSSGSGAGEGSDGEPVTGSDSANPEGENSGDGASGDPRVALATSRFLESVGVGKEPGSNVIEIRYQHEDAGIVQRVLGIHVDKYFDKHLAIYRPRRSNFDELKDEESALRLELPTLRASLQELEEQLRERSRGDATEHLKQNRGEVQGRLLAAEAELAQWEMVVKMLSSRERAEEEQTGGEDERPAAAPIPVPSPRVVQQYQDLVAFERSLKERKLELSTKFLPGSGSLAPVEQQLAELRRQREALVVEHPGLMAAAVARQVASGEEVDMNMQAARLASVDAKIEVYRTQLGSLEKRISDLAGLEAEITATRAELEAGAKRLEGLGERLKMAEREQKIDHRNIPNIDILQHPSDPFATRDKDAKRMILAVAGSGLVFGFALAFLLEVVIDRRIKRPAEIESRLRMPLMLVIPKLGMRSAVPRLEDAAGSWDEEQKLPSRSPALRPPTGSERMLGYGDAIRDRLLYYFELRGMRQKPKLIAMTGLSKGAGTSTLAAGVATSFARAGAKVLLVDMAGAQQGSGGLLTNGNGRHVEQPSSLGINSDDGMTFNTAGLNLSLASFAPSSESNGRAPMAPRRFYELMPNFRGSDFDYILFDLPSLDSTSATPAMAGFMDKVVLVLDAESTDREDLRRGYTELTRGRAEVSCVFNKTRDNVPRWLEG